MTLTLVLPCYNEAKRLPIEQIERFIEQAPEVQLCFMNDGSRDETAYVLQQLQQKHPRQIRVLGTAQNQGKAEAIRTAMRTLLAEPYGYNDFIGFWDADLATPLEESLRFLQCLNVQPQLHIMIGSRQVDTTGKIRRSCFRKITGACMHGLIRLLFRLPIEDTQCGAKLFRKEVAANLFAQPFHSQWLFDIELFCRLSHTFLHEHLFEMPLRQWQDVPGSKLSISSSGTILCQLFYLLWYYRLKRQPIVLEGNRLPCEF